MLKIGTFSKLSRLSIRMLRRYDELGLLQPVHTDPFTGYRYYREEQLTTAGRIAALRDMGFGLSAIGALLEDGGREELDRRLAEQQRVLEALLAETRQRLRLLETARAQLRKDESTMEYSVTLKNLPQRRAACVRMTLPSYEAEHQLWQVMARETAPLSLRLEEPVSAPSPITTGSTGSGRWMRRRRRRSGETTPTRSTSASAPCPP